MLIKQLFFNRSFLKNVLIIAIPMMLQQLVLSSVNMVDNLMVASLGDAAIGGVSAVNKYYVISTFATFGLCAAASVFVAQFYGAQKQEGMKQSFRFMMVSAFTLNCLFLIFGFAFKQQIVSYFSNDASVVSFGTSYMSIALWTLLPLSVVISMNSAIRAIESPKILIITSGIAVIVNVIFNYILIYGHFGFSAYGVQGAAMATFIARMVEMILGFFVLKMRDYQFKTKMSQLLQIEKYLIIKILTKALPLCANEILWSFGMATIFKFYATRGVNMMSGIAIASTIADLFFILGPGLSAATTVLIAQRLGANKVEEAKEVAYRLIGVSFCLSIVLGIIMMFTSALLPIIYKNITIETCTIATTILQIQGIMFWVYLTTSQSYFILRAGGDSKSTLMMDSGFLWVVNIPMLYMVTYYTDFSYAQLYWFAQIANILKMLFSFYLVKKEKWANVLVA